MRADPNPEYSPEGKPTHTFWQQATPGTSYWRCHISAKALGAQSIKLNEQDFQKEVIISPFGEKIETGELLFPRQYGTAVWQFPGNPTRQRIIRQMQDRGIRCLVESDDNYTIPHPGIPGVISEWKAKQGDGAEHTSRQVHVQVCAEADGIIVSTPWLEKFYSQFDCPVYVCPNSIDPDDWPEPEKPDDGVLRIGFAYSSSHYYDLAYIWDALEWAAQQPKVEVLLMGAIFPEMAAFNRLRFVHLPWQNNLADYRKHLQLFDVGLCPVRPGDWHNSRSDIKAMEYAMSGAVSVCAPTESYKPWRHLDSEACLFPDERNRPKDWLKTVKYIVSNRDLISQFAMKAKEHILSKRTIESSKHLWLEALEG